MIDALFKINNVQKRVIDIDDLLNIEVVHDNLRKFDEAWEITPRAPERESENELSQGIYHRQQKKRTSMQNASAPNHSNQMHRKEPKSYLKLKNYGRRFIERPATTFSNYPETKKAG